MAVRVLDPTSRIVELVWTGRETPDDVEAANRQLKSAVEQIGTPFDLLVDMRTVVAWSQETKSAVIEHQRLLLGWGLRRASVVVGSAITKMQLNGVKKASRNDKESQWLTYEEALEFLRRP